MTSARYLSHWRALLVFLVIGTGLLTLSRFLSLLAFGEWNELAGHASELGRFAWLGLRFDLKLLAITSLIFYWLPVVLLGALLPARRLQSYLGAALPLALVLLAFLACVDLGYRIFFGSAIDVLIFGFLEDDTSAVIKTLLMDWRLVAVSTLFLVAAFALPRGYSRGVRFLGRSGDEPPQRLRFFVSFQLVLLLTLLLLGRGSLDTFPLRSSNASVGNSVFINSLITNSAFNLQRAFDDRKESGINRRAADVLNEAQVSAVQQLERLAGFDQEAPLIARTSRKTTPLPHVVLVLKEGWSTEIALGHGPGNQVLGDFAPHMAEDHFFRTFYSNAYGTNPSVEALLLNSPITPLSQSPARRVRFELSNVLPFKRAGYRAMFFSGGDSAWRNHERFWPVQGFDAYVGRAAIEKKYRVDASDNPWGVYEEYLFAAVRDALSEAEAAGVPLFAFVMTTNNHPPVRLPKSYVAPALDPSVYGFATDDAGKHAILTGYHYQTDQLGKLLGWIKGGRLRDRVVLAATGDHVIKGFTDYSSAERRYLRYSVPAYFYTPPQYDRLKSVPKTVAGSHEDIFPTLFELALSDVGYFRFGTPLMEKLPERSYGWLESREFVFPDGVSGLGSEVLFPWADIGVRALVRAESRPVAGWERAVMAREQHRKLLKEWLLLRDFERQASPG